MTIESLGATPDSMHLFPWVLIDTISLCWHIQDSIPRRFCRFFPRKGPVSVIGCRGNSLTRNLESSRTTIGP